ncbi:ABC transporter substrate-binding protein [Rhizobium azibense]|uniref:Carbohydrate ABC transporter substrate-binding protein (CUT1 family) n=1 Tax=Rhizobium azibense TaxID=1136135 RepID=A0A4R3RS54_9HYPH|nr:ABC transporter substrate-binding protein [Rhizobium azibense]TCU38870.1 carbohydrate ABC transporter substrate-binding protein (CUT1 family) [Rhizobium azibense]
MTLRISRRNFMAGGATLLSLSAFGSGAFAQDKRLRLLWWGSQPRADRTNKVSELYKAKNPGTSITGEFLGWGDYWPRLATQVAGKNAPDVIQMDYRYIVEYAHRGALAPLDSYMPSKLNLSDFDKAQIEGGSVDGHLYGVSLGANSAATMLNTTAFEEAGIDLPSKTTTWEEFGRMAAELTKAGKRKGLFGMADGSGGEPLFENYLRQRGKALYTADAKVGFGVEEASEWFDMWNKFRESGACVPPDIQALDKNDIETNTLTLGKSAAGFAHSNQFVAYQQMNKDKLTLANHMRVTKDSKGGHYRKPSMFFSVSSQSKVVDEAVDYVNFFVTNPEAALALGVERGIPESAAMREVVAAKLDAVGKVPLEYVSGLGDLAGKLPPPPPAGAGEGELTLRNISEQVGFGQLTAADGAKQLVDELTRILARG